MNSTRNIHPPIRRHPFPPGFPHLQTDVDTQAEQHQARTFKKLRYACAAPELHPDYAQQAPQETLVPFASLSAISGTFNSLSKVLFIFPSWYLFAIGLKPIFSFR